MIAACINHLWQSTVFAIAAGLLTLILRKNRAQVRYRLWLLASIKFLIPFSLFITAGTYLERAPVTHKLAIGIGAPSFAVAQFSQPFAEGLTPAPVGSGDTTMVVLACVWALGFAGLTAMRLREWLRVRRLVGASTRMEMPLPIEVRSSMALMEPAIVGIVRPILLIPAGIQDRLTPVQLESVMVHELCHVRRRDNFTAAIHMTVEAAFWFHPLVWWIGTRLMEERERTCDEEVLRLGIEPQVYANGILSICEAYFEPPFSFMSGITGSNLRKRINTILGGHLPGDLKFSRKAVLAAAAIAAIGIPVLAGMISAVSARVSAQTPEPVRTDRPASPASNTAPARAQAAPARDGRRGGTAPAEASNFLAGLGNVTPAATVTIKSRIDGQLLSVGFQEGRMVQTGQLLASIDPKPFELQVSQTEGQLLRDQAGLTNARGELDRVKALSAGTISKPQIDAQTAAVTALEATVITDQAKVNLARVQLSYAQIRSPITGMAGLRLVDPGNVVYAAAGTPGIVVITQTQPIAVVFQLPEDLLPAVLTRLRQGDNAHVEAWDRSNSRKLATGQLVAVNNQIDAESGTAKLKAMFDNQDGALFPNQFVNVRLYLGR